MVAPTAQQPNSGGGLQKRRARKRKRKRQRKKKQNLKLIESGQFDDLRLYLNAKRMVKDAKKAKLKPIPGMVVFPYVKTMVEEQRKKQAADEIAARMLGLSLS